MAGGIAISVGALAQGLDHGTEKLTDIKFQLVDPEWEKGQLLNGAAAFTAGACLGSLQASLLSSVCCMLTVNLAYAMVAAVMVACVELKAKGSGIPEIKGSREPLRLCFVQLHGCPSSQPTEQIS